MTGHRVETFGTPPSEPYCYWLRCGCGHVTSMHRTVGDARRELERLHRQEVTA